VHTFTISGESFSILVIKALITPYKNTELKYNREIKGGKHD
jgi:hypothetical protein